MKWVLNKKKTRSESLRFCSLAMPKWWHHHEWKAHIQKCCGSERFYITKMQRSECEIIKFIQIWAFFLRISYGERARHKHQPTLSRYIYDAFYSGNLYMYIFHLFQAFLRALYACECVFVFAFMWLRCFCISREFLLVCCFFFH